MITPLQRSALPLLCAALAGCFDAGPSGFATVLLDPILDSVFVGDQIPPPAVTYFDRAGNAHTPTSGSIRWGSTDTTVISVDPSAGTITGKKRGLALVSAEVQGFTGVALIAVSNTLDLTVLLDSIYMMTGDTLTVPVAVQKKSGPPAVVWYEAASNAVFTIDSAGGRVTATATGGPLPYIVHADTIADTGAVSVLALTDTTGGRFFFSIHGTANGRVGGPIRAVNYTRSDGQLAFRLRGTFDVPTFPGLQVVQITLPDSVIVAGSAYAIDSISPLEAGAQSQGQFVAICTPPRAWALWSYQGTTIVAYSRSGGRLGVTRIEPVSHGKAISGQFTYTAQRTDLYTDPLGALTIHGSFVAPLVTDSTSC